MPAYPAGRSLTEKAESAETGKFGYKPLVSLAVMSAIDVDSLYADLYNQPAGQSSCLQGLSKK
jgi:hypothetical protein